MIAPWITTDDLADATVDPVLAQEAIDAASFVLFGLSGRKYGGVRTTTEEYCQVGLDQLWMSTYYGPYGRHPLPGASGYPDPLAYPQLHHGVITNQVGGFCGTCGCTHLLRLRGGPVLNVGSLKIGGTTLDPADYAIYDHSFVTAPNRCWGLCDDVTVTYTYGAPPPALGRMAAKALADQYLLAMTGSEECELPQRITSVSRQGMSWTLLDPQDFLDKGRTGIYQVDLFLTTVNPDGARLRSRVFSPDLMRGKTKRSGAAPVGLMATPSAVVMSAPTPMLQMTSQVAAPPTGTVTIDPGRPLRWVVPGNFTQESPPTVVVRPSGEEVPPGALSWRTGNFTLDLTSEQVERLLPSGSDLVVSATTAGSPTGGTTYRVERRTQ